MSSEDESDWEIPERHKSLTKIEYLEGEHEKMPMSLVKRISRHMDAEGAKADFAMGKWRERTLTTSDGGAAWFEKVVDAAGTLETLTATRYKYGPQKQIVVVDVPKEDGGTRPAIVVGSGKSTYNKMQRGRPNIKAYVWHIWKPLRERDDSYKDKNATPSIVRIAEGSPVKEEPKDETILETPKASAKVNGTQAIGEHATPVKRTHKGREDDETPLTHRSKRVKTIETSESPNLAAKLPHSRHAEHEISPERIRELMQHLVTENANMAAADIVNDTASQYTRTTSTDPNFTVENTVTNGADRALFVTKIEPRDEQMQPLASHNIADDIVMTNAEIDQRRSSAMEEHISAPPKEAQVKRHYPIDIGKVEVTFETKAGEERARVMFEDCCTAGALFEEACAAGIAEPETRMLAVNVGKGDFAAIRKDNDHHFERSVMEPVRQAASRVKTSSDLSIRVRWYM